MRLLPFFLILLLGVHTVCASPLDDNPSRFNLKQANTQFDHINLQLSVQNLNIENLNTAITILSKLVSQADFCIEATQKKLTPLDLLIQQTTHAQDMSKTGADLMYLQSEHKKLANQQSQCRLFAIRAKEAINAYQTAISQLKQAETFTPGIPLWTLIQQLRTPAADTALQTPEDQTTELFVSNDWKSALASQLPAVIHSVFFWMLGLGVNILLASVLLYRMSRNRKARHYLRIKAILIKHVILLSLTLCATEFYGYLVLQPHTNTLLTTFTGGLALYLLGLNLIVLVFKIKKFRTFFYWNALDQDFFRYLLFVGLSFYMAAVALRVFIRSHLTNSIWEQLSQSFFHLAILGTAIYFIYYFCKAHRHFQFIKHHRHLMQRSCTLLLVTCALIDIFGYHTLAVRFTSSGCMTLAIIFITFLLNQGINKFYFLLHNSSTLNTAIIKYLGYKKDQPLTEFFILKFTAQVVTFAISLYLIGSAWGFATYYLERLYTQFLYGIHFGTLTFYPTRIVVGIIVFCLCYLLFRGISTAVSRRQQFEDEEETQVAIASILTYLGFAIALIAGLLVAGFDFTGLAIVAGALSVGIGLGLQSIVNNFVSGIILLIEKPIKPGDRINVDGVEGIVKKIRVRSTQITTPAREDIIVPNSDLITRRVTNYMYSDRHLSIHCEVGVAYGSNLELVQALLLNAAHNHDEIIKVGRSKPSVLFRSFGESNLNFQLWFLIKDANKKTTVQSDLNFAIERLFREHHIEMAFPQHDVHIKQSLS